MCVETRWVGNLSWGVRFTRRFPPCVVNGPQVLFPSKGKIAVQSHTAITSIVDSASQNLITNKSARSAKPHKSFCYFWLLPKVESSLPYQPQLTSDSTIPQNLIQNKSVRSTRKLARFVVQKIGIKGAEVPPADFLLETDKRGTPPKSEDGCFLGTHLKVVGGGVGGVQPFLRKKTSESKSRRIVGDSKVAKMDSSLIVFRLNNDEFGVDCHESLCDSRNDEIYPSKFYDSAESHTK